MADPVVALTPAKEGLKNKQRELVAAVGGQEACPPFARYRRHQTYSDFGNPQMPDSFMPADVIADLESVTRTKPGHPIVTSYLCTMAGGVFVKLPQASPSEDGFLDVLAKLTAEYGDLSTGLIIALRDRKVTADEVRGGNLLSACDDLAAVVMQIRMQLERVEAEG
jgi:hypothetical protein